jgi:hypothetical protein
MKYITLAPFLDWSVLHTTEKRYIRQKVKICQTKTTSKFDMVEDILNGRNKDHILAVSTRTDCGQVDDVNS